VEGLLASSLTVFGIIVTTPMKKILTRLQSGGKREPFTDHCLMSWSEGPVEPRVLSFTHREGKDRGAKLGHFFLLGIISKKGEKHGGMKGVA